MSSEMKILEQSNKVALTRVPKLRFPEFRDSASWDKKELNKLLTIGSGKDYKHLSMGDIPVYGSGGYMLSVNDYLYDGESVCIGRKGTIDKPIFLTGKFWTVDTLFYTHSFIECSPKFIFYQFQKINWKNYNEAGGIPSLSKTTIGKIEIRVPSFSEQQKIADCLSSLDNVISLQTQKIDALQQYKKGLMQKLFPAEGETVPELRFSEFRNEPSWDEKKLSDVSPSIFDGTHQTPKYEYEGIPFFSVENIVSGKENKFISKDDFIVATKKNKPEKDDILLTRIGKIGFSKVVDWDYDFSVYVTLAVIKKSKIFNSFYMHYFMQSNRYQADIHGKSLLNAVPCKINMDNLRKTLILLPKLNEQKKIADCLSSIDKLIDTETQKLAALKNHKTGLMQQLFPAMDEVNA